MTKGPRRYNDDFDYLGFAHRLRLARIALGLTEAEAAATATRSVRTWKKYEATGKGRSMTWPIRCFVNKYELSYDWLLCGEGGMFRRGRREKQPRGKIAILPTKSPVQQRGVDHG
jgi:hypothetical protein